MAAGLTVIVFEGNEARVPVVNLSVICSARSSARLVKRATPPETVAVVVPLSGPMPVLSIAVITVELSPVKMLLNESSSKMTGWVAKG